MNHPYIELNWDEIIGKLQKQLSVIIKKDIGTRTTLLTNYWKRFIRKTAGDAFIYNVVNRWDDMVRWGYFSHIDAIIFIHANMPIWSRSNRPMVTWTESIDARNLKSPNFVSQDIDIHMLWQGSSAFGVWFSFLLSSTIPPGTRPQLGFFWAYSFCPTIFFSVQICGPRAPSCRPVEKGCLEAEFIQDRVGLNFILPVSSR